MSFNSKTPLLTNLPMQVVAVEPVQSSATLGIYHHPYQNNLLPRPRPLRVHWNGRPSKGISRNLRVNPDKKILLWRRKWKIPKNPKRMNLMETKTEMVSANCQLLCWMKQIAHQWQNLKMIRYQFLWLTDFWLTLLTYLSTYQLSRLPVKVINSSKYSMIIRIHWMKFLSIKKRKSNLLDHPSGKKRWSLNVLNIQKFFLL